MQTRRQLAIDPEMCMFALTMSTAEPKNIKEAMADHVWIKAMQEDLHQFDRLNVWELVDKPLERLQPDGFVNPGHSEKVYCQRKALYGLKQAPSAWYNELSTFLISKCFTKGAIDSNLFMIRYGEDILLVQIYVDDIIFESTNPKFSKKFEKLMHSRFEMSLIGEMKFFLGLQIHQSPRDLSGTLIDQTRYRSMIGSLMYVTSSIPDIVQAVCYCARYQARPTEKHLKEVKRIFRYLKNTINMGLWYSKDSGDKLVSWMSKKQDCTAMLTSIVRGVICKLCSTTISCNPVQHSRTKHINVRDHFIKEQVERGIVELYFFRTEYQLADMFTKALSQERFKYLVGRLDMRCLTPAKLEVLANESA
ncbi:retrovirus-related pol polyprotein from transposon TNT 1-94 [Tanacetum coccineum]|uniref:Retrovirus-related pol polyprotein from transposon TNT 1-94 n=1 Tax=Tanacetum coccineum TaxID=301880 RepID=A0ABQ4X1F3_9ASTR